MFQRQCEGPSKIAICKLKTAYNGYSIRFVCLLVYFHVLNNRLPYLCALSCVHFLVWILYFDKRWYDCNTKKIMFCANISLVKSRF